MARTNTFSLRRLQNTFAELAMASVPRFVTATVAGAVLLVAPITAWSIVGDSSVLRAGAVLLASLLLSCAVVRQILRPIRGLHAVAAAPQPPAPRTAATSCRSVRRQPRRSGQPALRGRNTVQLLSCRAAIPHPAPGSRVARDVHCLAAARPLARRTVRRRTRP